MVKNIKIKNFKSIKNVSVPIQCYGEGESKSFATFFVGVNESGKSAILEAISLVNKGFEGIDYNNYCHKEHQEQNYNYIDIYAEIVLKEIDILRKTIIEKTKLSEKFVNNIDLLNLNKNIYLDDKGFSETYNVNINDNLPFYEYIINKETQVVAGTGKSQVIETIECLSELNNIDDIITQENAITYLKENQILLTKELLEKKLAVLFKPILNKSMPNIQIWRPNPKYLINETIDLEKFKDDPDISIPLKNIFLIYGKTTNEEIKNSIERALTDQAKCDELKEKMSEEATKYINKIWKEHNIKVKISINSTNCEVHVEDKDKKYFYYTMEQRSDGFKHFFSLLLSLSAQSRGNILKENIILIDEPEIHLHPSGIRYMRDEILKIGERNYVFVATHSNYMIDNNVKERHWVVKKEKAETKITQVSDGYNFADDKVLSAAFGLNIIKELLPQNIIIVEGENDKKIMSHAINLLYKTFFYSIKEAGGASKIPIFAQVLKEENVMPFILFDADNEGKDYKKKILDKRDNFYTESNVFTIKDLLTDLPKDSTIEDLLPVEFVKEYFEKEMECDFNLDENDTFIHQLKRQSKILQDDKNKLDSIKKKLANSFCDKYKLKLEERVPKLVSVVNALFNKIEECNKKNKEDI